MIILQDLQEKLANIQEKRIALKVLKCDPLEVGFVRCGCKYTRRTSITWGLHTWTDPGGRVQAATRAVEDCD